MIVIKAEQSINDIHTSNFSEFKKTTRSKIISKFKRDISSYLGEKKAKLPSYSDVIEDLRKKLGRG